MLNRLLKEMAMLDSAVLCRICGQAVHRHDHLGLSESVCGTCRD